MEGEGRKDECWFMRRTCSVLIFCQMWSIGEIVFVWIEVESKPKSWAFMSHAYKYDTTLRDLCLVNIQPNNVLCFHSSKPNFIKMPSSLCLYIHTITLLLFTIFNKQSNQLCIHVLDFNININCKYVFGLIPHKIQYVLNYVIHVNQFCKFDG